MTIWRLNSDQRDDSVNHKELILRIILPDVIFILRNVYLITDNYL